MLQGVPLPKLPVIVGEISAYDQGLNAADNTDTTRYSSSDKAWLSRTAQYLKSLAATSNQGSGFSWLLWCWNANSRECHNTGRSLAAGMPCIAGQRATCTAAGTLAWQLQATQVVYEHTMYQICATGPGAHCMHCC
jgi:hypothetical protein